tara:strand:- start:1113 stop:1373 length:261 start_codon:yes stop_codon:yes gene_type:complete
MYANTSRESVSSKMACSLPPFTVVTAFRHVEQNCSLVALKRVARIDAMDFSSREDIFFRKKFSASRGKIFFRKVWRFLKIGAFRCQ